MTLYVPQAAIFDLDGTLFQTETLLLPAYRRMFETLRGEGLYEGETPPEERILGGLGMLLEQIWERVLPGSSPELKRKMDELLLRYQLEGLERGEGELYPEVAAVLKRLRDRGIRLFVASNGLEDYVKGVVRFKKLSHLFDGLYSAGEHRTSSKVELVRLLLTTHGIRKAWMAGDRSSDVEAGKKNGLAVVGCEFAGFGRPEELADADVRIHRFADLLSLLPPFPETESI